MPFRRPPVTVVCTVEELRRAYDLRASEQHAFAFSCSPDGTVWPVVAKGVSEPSLRRDVRGDNDLVALAADAVLRHESRGGRFRIDPHQRVVRSLAAYEVVAVLEVLPAAAVTTPDAPSLPAARRPQDVPVVAPVAELPVQVQVDAQADASVEVRLEPTTPATTTPTATIAVPIHHEVA